MIRVYVFRDKKNQIEKIVVAGHAGYAERGRDIVCAAVSGAAGVLIAGFRKDPYLETCYKVKDAGAYMVFSTPRFGGDLSIIEAGLLLNSFYGFIKGISKQYRNFITVYEKRKRGAENVQI